MNNSDHLKKNGQSSAFQATRFTSSTFMIKEYNDIYSERPQIYVKVITSSSTVLVIDTGCGGASKDPETEITSLREFIETVDLEDNQGKPINEGGRMCYVIVATHCHYDHILGVDQFKNFPVFASSYSPSFLSPPELPEHSLCQSLGISTPLYRPTLVPNHYIIPGSDGVFIIHTPGHTPDEIALYDAAEGMLYVGDSLYEDEIIIFPKEGSIIAWISSVESLISLVRAENGERDGIETKEVLINAGHCTFNRPALEMLEAVKAFMGDVVAGREDIIERIMVRGEENVVYIQKGGRFSLRCPERLVEEARGLCLDVCLE